MKAYQKYILKDVKNLVSKLVAIVLIVMLGVAFLVGLLTTAPNMRYSVGKYYSDYNMADVVIQKGSLFTETEIDDLIDDKRFSEVMPYLMVDETIEIYQSNHVARIMLLDFQKGISINKLSIVEGRMPQDNSDYIEVVVEKGQIYLLDIEIGYETTALGKTFKVVGIVQNPWYFAYVQEISELSQRPIEAMIYADQSYLEENYSHVAIKVKGANDFDMFSSKYERFIKDIVEDLQVDYKTYYFTTRQQNQSFVKYQSDINIVEAIALIFPVFFFLITILVSMSSITKIISDQRTQIGTLQSLGYPTTKIIWKYSFYAIISSGLGTILGISLGIYLIPAVIYNAYLTSYNLPSLSIEYHFLYITVISITMILSVLLVTIFSLIGTLKEKPTELLRLKAPKPGKKIFLERMTWLWKRLKFRYKSTLRNIFRHKRNLILTLIGVAGSTALLLAGFGIKDSVEFAGKHQFDEMIQYDLEIGTKSNQTDIDALTAYERMDAMMLMAKYESDNYIRIVVPKDEDAFNDYIHFKNINRQTITMNNQSVLVTKEFALNHNIKENETIVLEIQGIKNNLTVTGIVDYYFGNYIYLSSDVLNSEVDLIYNRVFVKTGLLDKHTKIELHESLKDDTKVTQIFFDEDSRYSFNKTSESMNSIIIVLVLAASALAIIINYNLTLINISTRQREIATLKVIGYQEVEVSGYVFRETVLISTIAIGLGILLGKVLHYFIISQIVVDGVLLSNQINWLSYVLTLVLSFVFIGIVYLISLPKMRKIDMIDALKSYE